MTSRRTPEEVKAVIAAKIPAGLVTPEHTQTAHWYRHNPTGLLLASVTGIVGITGGGEHLKKWAAQLAVDRIEENIEHFKTLDSSARADFYRSAVLAHKDTLEDAGGIGTEGHGVAEAYIKKWLETGEQPKDIQEYITGEDSRLWAISRSAQKFFNDYYAIPVASELKVAHVWGKKQEGYAGTLDAIMYLAFPDKEESGSKDCQHIERASSATNWERIECMNCGKKWRYYLTLVDFKTSNSIWQFPTPAGKIKGVKDDYVMQTSAYHKALKWMTGISMQSIVVVRLDKAVEKYEVGEVYDFQGAYKAFVRLKRAYDFTHSEHQKSATLATKETISIKDL